MNKDIIPNREPLLEVSKFKQMASIQYEAIPVVKDIECPNCHKSDVDAYPPQQYAKPV